MPTINFNSFSLIKPKRVYQKQKTPKYTTIVGEQIGVCRYSITRKRFEIFLLTTQEFYPFTVESYVLKNVKYSTQLFDNRILVRDEILPDVGNNTINCLTDKYFVYLPFMAGIFCKGTLVTNNITKETEFQLKDTTINWKHPVSKQYIKEYIANYEEIRNEFRRLQCNREE